MTTALRIRALLVLALGATLLACPKTAPPCSQDGECPAGLSCRSQQCVDLRCAPACDAGFACANKQCFPTSCPTGACAPGLLCDGTACAAPFCLGTCSQGEQCGSDGKCYLKSCIGHACPNNNICTIDAHCADRGCLTDACDGGGVCSGGICYQTSCPDAGSCGLSQVCFDGGCSDPLCFGVTCTTGNVCVGGICELPSCVDGIKDGTESDIDCGGSACTPCPLGGACAARTDCLSRRCATGICIPCGTAADCSTGELCGPGTDAGGYCANCANTAQCPSGTVCDQTTNLCGPCQGNGDCDGGFICNSSGSCVGCTATTQCDNGLVCVAPSCSPCTSNSQCLNNQVCLGQACGPCTNSNQCNPGQVCNVSNGQCGTCVTYFKDNDGDGWGNTTQSTCATTRPSGYVLDAGDCDDNDPTVHPGQAAFFTTPRDAGGFDYNCSGAAEADPTFNCSETIAGCATCSSTRCAGRSGYDDAGIPACGQSGNFCYCTWEDFDGGADAGPDCSVAVGTVTCAGGGCPAGHNSYLVNCLPQQIGCH